MFQNACSNVANLIHVACGRGLSLFEYFLFQFCERRVFTKWSDTGDMVHAHGQSDPPGSSSGAMGGSDGESHDAQSEVWLSNKFLLSVIGHLGW